jgi:hypothetical protein
VPGVGVEPSSSLQGNKLLICIPIKPAEKVETPK